MTPFFPALAEESGWAAPAILAAIVFIVISVLIWLLIRWYIEPSNPEERKEAISLLFQTLGGFAFLLGVYFTWQQLMTSREELITTQQGQITERFTRAIDQLGKTDEGGDSQKSLAIRLGGIYALERIAKNSKDDHPAIMEVLTAFVRQNTPWAVEKESEKTVAAKLQPDTQAALTVIGRRELTYQNGESQKLNLAGIDLRGAVLRKAKLGGADMKSTHFENAFLNEIQLNDADLFDARFNGAILEGANLRGAILRGAVFHGASVKGADFTGADLTGADLTGTDLRGAVGLDARQINSALTDATTIKD